MSDYPVPPSTLSLVQGAGQAIQTMPRMAHPLTEQLVRDIEAGRKTAQQAFEEAQAFVTTAQQPPAEVAPQAPMQAPQQPVQPQQAAPAPTLAGPPQAPAPAPIAGPSLAQPAASPAPSFGFGGRGGPMPAQVPATPPVETPPIPSPADSRSQPNPMANADNAGPAASFNQNLGAGRNQIRGSLTQTQPPIERTRVPEGGVNAQTSQSTQTQPGAPRPATGYAAAKNAIQNAGPRMSNEDVQIYMDAFVKSGRAQSEAIREQGRNERDARNRAIKNRNLDLKEQGLQDAFDRERGRLSLEKQKEADKLAMHIERLAEMRDELQAKLARAKESGYDRIELQNMKDTAALVRTQIQAQATVGGSLQAEAPGGKALLTRIEGRLQDLLRDAERVATYTTATHSDPNAPARTAAKDPQGIDPEAPPIPTVSERSGIKKKQAAQKPQTPAPAASTPAKAPAYKNGQKAKFPDGSVRTYQNGKWL